MRVGEEGVAFGVDVCSVAVAGKADPSILVINVQAASTEAFQRVGAGVEAVQDRQALAAAVAVVKVWPEVRYLC